MSTPPARRAKPEPPKTGVGARWEGLSPVFRRRAILTLVIALVLGLAVGYSRGSAGVTLGETSSGTPITAPPGPVTGPTTPPAAFVAPDVPLTTVNFDDGMPRDVNFATTVYNPKRWVGANGSAIVAVPVEGPVEPGAPAYDADRDWVVDPGGSLQVVQVTLVAPTPHSGVIARFQDADNYFAVLADQTMTHVELVEVRNGEATTRGFVDKVVTPGTVVGLVGVGNEVTISIDGEPQVLDTFFGPQTGVSYDGLTATGIGMLAGSGQPVFDDLQFG